MEARKLCQAAQTTLQAAVPKDALLALRPDGSLILNPTLLSPLEFGKILVKHGSLGQLEGNFYRLAPGWQAHSPGSDILGRVQQRIPLPQQPCLRPDGTVVLAIQDEFVALSEFYFEGCTILGSNEQRPHALVEIPPATFQRLTSAAPPTPAAPAAPVVDPLVELLTNPPQLISRDNSPKRRESRGRRRRLSATDEPSPERPRLVPPTHTAHDHTELGTVLGQLNGQEDVDYGMVCMAIERVRELRQVSLTISPIQILAEALWSRNKGPTRATIERLVNCLHQHPESIEEDEFLWHFVLGGPSEHISKLLGNVTCRRCGGFRKPLKRTLPHVWSAHMGADFDPQMPAIPTLAGMLLDALKPSQEAVALLLAEKRPLLAALGVQLPDDIQDLKVTLCRCRCSQCHKKIETRPLDIGTEWFPLCEVCLPPIRKLPRERRRFWTIG